MENNSDTLIQDKFKTLPIELQKVLSIVPWKEMVKKIGDQQKLSADEIELLETETLLVLYKFVNIEDFPSNIQRELEVEEETSHKLAEIIDKEVFTEIIKKINEQAHSSNHSPSVNLSEFKEIEPAKPELLISVPSYTQTPTTSPEENLPAVIEPKKFGYGGGVDPYREQV